MALVVLLMAPGASALAGLEAHAVTVRGTFSLQGGLAGLHLGTDGPIEVGADLAGSGAVAVQVADTHYNRSTYAVALSQPWYRTQQADHDEPFAVHFLDHAEIMVLPSRPGSATVRTTVSTASFEGSAGAQGRFHDIDGHPAVDGTFDVGPSVAPAWDGAVDLVVQGDFRVLLWDSAALFDGVAYGSGEAWSRMAPPFDQTYLVMYQYDKTVVTLTVRDGSLTIPGLRDGGGLFLASAALDGSGDVDVEDAVLLKASGPEPVGEVRFRGDSAFGLSPAGSRLLVTPVDVAQAVLMGRTVAWTGASAAWPWLAGGAAGLVLLGILVATGPGVRLVRLERRLGRREYGRVASASGRVFRSVRTRARASLFKATAMLALGRYADAHGFLSGLVPGDLPDPATYYFLRAHAAAGLGDRDAARRDLEACLDLAPSYRVEASGIRLLRPFVVQQEGRSYV